MSKQVAKSFTKQLQSFIQNNSTPQGSPMIGTISNVSSNLQFCNIRTDNGTLVDIPTFGIPKKDTTAIILFIGGNLDKPVALCNPINVTDNQQLETFLTSDVQNFHSNGDFRHENTGYKGSFTIDKNTSYTKDGYCAVLSAGGSLSFDCTIPREYKNFFKVQFYYYSLDSVLKIQVMDKDTSKVINTLPERTGYDHKLWIVKDGTWRVNRETYKKGDHKNITVNITNVGDYDVLIDGIVVYDENTDSDFYLSKEDILNG